MLATLGKRLSDASGLPADRLIILWEFIPPGQFLFKGETAAVQPAGSHHPIVDIAALETMPRKTIEALVETLVQTLSQGLSMAEENICVVVSPIRSGNLYVGGEFKPSANAGPCKPGLSGSGPRSFGKSA